MNEKHLQDRVKTIAVQSAELVECFQWSETDYDRKKARIVALKLAEHVEALLEELK
jgi:hypothetical protein